MSPLLSERGMCFIVPTVPQGAASRSRGRRVTGPNSTADSRLPE
jgi:hypothetical protein